MAALRFRHRTKANYRTPQAVESPFEWRGRAPLHRVLDAIAKVKTNKELLKAARVGDELKVIELLENGVDVNIRNKDGWTPLMMASGIDCTWIVRFMIEKGADIDATDNNGWTALMWAAFFGKTKTARCLLDNGADVDLMDVKGRTALMLTTYYNRTKTAELLKGYGATG